MQPMQLRSKCKDGGYVGCVQLMSKSDDGYVRPPATPVAMAAGFVPSSSPDKPAWGQTLPAMAPGTPKKDRISSRPPPSAGPPDDAANQGCGSLIKLLIEGIISILKKK